MSSLLPMPGSDRVDPLMLNDPWSTWTSSSSFSPPEKTVVATRSSDHKRRLRHHRLIASLQGLSGEQPAMRPRDLLQQRFANMEALLSDLVWSFLGQWRLDVNSCSDVP